MEINQLKQFCVIVETGGFRSACVLLHISPGALSRSMKILQDSMGAQFFIPEGRGIQITEEGRAFYVMARQVCNDFERMTVNWREKKTTAREIRIATFEVFSSHFLARILQDEPLNVEYHTLERTPGQLEASIQNGEADFGLTYLPIPMAGVEHLAIIEFRNFAFAQNERFKNVALSEVPFAVPTTSVVGAPTGQKSLDMWPNEVPRYISFQFELLETALATTRNGRTALFCPEFVIKAQNEALKDASKLFKIKLPSTFPKVSGQIFLVKRKNATETPVMKKFCAMIRKFVRV